MAHVRKQVRDWLKANMVGSADAGSRVEVRRSLPLPDALQPTLLISVQGEASSDRSQGDNPTQLRVVTARVTACAKGDAEATEDVMDRLAVFVEETLAANPTLGGVAETYEYQSTEFAFNAAGDKTLCTAALSFAVIVLTARNDPETNL